MIDFNPHIWGNGFNQKLLKRYRGTVMNNLDKMIKASIMTYRDRYRRQGIYDTSKMILLVPIEYETDAFLEWQASIPDWIEVNWDDFWKHYNSLPLEMYGYPVIFRNCDEIMLVEDDRK